MRGWRPGGRGLGRAARAARCEREGGWRRVAGGDGRQPGRRQPDAELSGAVAITVGGLANRSELRLASRKQSRVEIEPEPGKFLLSCTRSVENSRCNNAAKKWFDWALIQARGRPSQQPHAARSCLRTRTRSVSGGNKAATQLATAPDTESGVGTPRRARARSSPCPPGSTAPGRRHAAMSRHPRPHPRRATAATSPDLDAKSLRKE